MIIIIRTWWFDFIINLNVIIIIYLWDINLFYIKYNNLLFIYLFVLFMTYLPPDYFIYLSSYSVWQQKINLKLKCKLTFNDKHTNWEVIVPSTYYPAMNMLRIKIFCLKNWPRLLAVSLVVVNFCTPVFYLHDYTWYADKAV